MPIAKPTPAATPTRAALLEIDDSFPVDLAATAAAFDAGDVSRANKAGAVAGAATAEAEMAGGGGCGGMVDCLRSTICRTAAPA